MNEIKRFRYNDLLLRLFGLQQAPAPVVGVEVVPVIIVEDDRPEHAHLKGERICGTTVYCEPAAGKIAYFQLANPATSGMLVTVLRVHGLLLSAPPAPNFYEVHASGGQSTGTPSSAKRYLDFRLDAGAGARPASLVVAGADLIAQVVPLGLTVLVEPGLLNTMTDLSRMLPIILPPGTNLVVTWAAADITFQVGAVWRERPVAEDELNP